MNDLLQMDVSARIEKKNGLAYLSWAWAWAEVLKIDPLATWEVVEFSDMPACFLPDKSAMVKTIVTIKGSARSCWLPVMDHKNAAIKSPDAFAINKAIMRCMTKAISMHGLGLYIYAGEDLPEPPPVLRLSEAQAAEIKELLQSTATDSAPFLEWVSKGAGERINSVEAMPVAAFVPAQQRLINKLKEVNQ